MRKTEDDTADMSPKSQRRRSLGLPWVATAVLMFFVVGMAACMACDLDGCCDEPGGDGVSCVCGCAIHSTLGMVAPSVSAYHDRSFELEAAAPQVYSSHRQPLLRPPRS